jgi:hypothetical protein
MSSALTRQQRGTSAIRLNAIVVLILGVPGSLVGGKHERLPFN